MEEELIIEVELEKRTDLKKILKKKKIDLSNYEEFRTLQDDTTIKLYGKKKGE